MLIEVTGGHRKPHGITGVSEDTDTDDPYTQPYVAPHSYSKWLRSHTVPQMNTLLAEGLDTFCPCHCD